MNSRTTELQLSCFQFPLKCASRPLCGGCSRFLSHHFNAPFFSSSLISGTCHFHFQLHSFLPLTCNENTVELDPSPKDICASYAPSAFFLTSIPRCMHFHNMTQACFQITNSVWCAQCFLNIRTGSALCARKRTKKKKGQKVIYLKEQRNGCGTCAAT